jgi:hypothetical protein
MSGINFSVRRPLRRCCNFESRLEHVPYPIRALCELNRIIKRGGLLILKLPLDDWRTQRQVDPADINHHLYTWTPQLLYNCLVEAGYKHIRVGGHTDAWCPFALKVYGRVPNFAFDTAFRLSSMVRRQRQLTAVVRTGPDPTDWASIV